MESTSRPLQGEAHDLRNACSARRLLRWVRKMRLLRVHHARVAAANHTKVARRKTPIVASRGKHSQHTRAKPASPMQPMAAPAASTPATVRPRIVPSRPALALCLRSCASTRLAPAGKIAGNARNNPPISGPKRLEISPAVMHTPPPNRNRITHSCAWMPLIAASLACTDHGFRSTSQSRTTDTPNHSGRSASAAASA